MLAPVDMHLSVDEDFTNFVKKRLMGRSLSKGDRILVMMLGHQVPFDVIRINPLSEKSDGVTVEETTNLQILNDPYTLSKSQLSDTKFLFRKEWLQSCVQRLGASRTTFSIVGTEIESENEAEIIEKANAILEDSFNPTDISVKFHSSSGDVLGSLPWISISLLGGLTSVHPGSPNSKIVQCFKVGVNECPKDIRYSPKHVFLAIVFSPQNQDLYNLAVRPALEGSGLELWKADEPTNNVIDAMCKICRAVQESAYVIADISDWKATVLFEIGLAYGMGKNVVVLKKKEAGVPVDLRGLEYLEYESTVELKRNIEVFFKGMSNK